MTLSDSALRSEVAQKNYDSLVGLMHEYSFTLPAKDFPNWRPTKRSVAPLRGLDPLGAVTILCTNGILAMFLRPDGSLLYGHLSNFDGEVKPLHSMPYQGAVKEKSTKPRKAKTDAAAKPKKVTAADAIAYLQQFIDQHKQS